MSDAGYAFSGIAFAALVVWMGVRIVNRRERWAIRLAIVVGALVAYPLSFGPACWIASGDFGEEAIRVAYRPLFGIIQGHGPRVVQKWLHRYAEWGVPRGYYLFKPNERMAMASGWDISDILVVSWPIVLAVSMAAVWIGLRRLRGRGANNPPASNPDGRAESG